MCQIKQLQNPCSHSRETAKKGGGCLGWLTGIVATISVTIGGVTVVFDNQVDNFLMSVNTQYFSSDARIMQTARNTVKVVACPDTACLEPYYGSGVIIQLEGQLRVLTALHVIKNAQEIKVWFSDPDPYSKPNSEKTNVELVKQRTELDVALLRFCFSGSCPDRGGVPIGDSDVFENSSDTQLELFGFPLKKGQTLSRKQLNFAGYETKNAISRAYIRTNKKISGGYSGGPAINTSGELIGIALSDRTGAGTGILLTSNRIKEFLWK
ncbi:MAG: serine protease [Deinococcales bacterium]